MGKLDIKIIIIQLLVTSLLFYIEALIHFSIGKTGFIGFTIPPAKQNIVMIITILIFSSLSTLITRFVEHNLKAKI